MADLFLKYMTDRLVQHHSQDNQFKSEPGPVITISRETGCSAREISQLLYEKIVTEFFQGKPDSCPWRLINKDILQNSASKLLGLLPSELDYVFKEVERGTISEILDALSTKYYHSDRKKKKIIINVIKSMAEQGNIIFLGRGSVAVTRKMKHSFHIKLMAPLEWRIEQVMSRFNYTKEKATAFVDETDKQRAKLIECFGGNASYSLFDATFNTATLTHEEIVDQILTLALHRGFFQYNDKAVSQKSYPLAAYK
jgi:cytidylate kinase